MLCRKLINRYATQIHATVKGWKDGQIFSWLGKLDQYDEGRDGQQRQLKDEGAEGVEEIKQGNPNAQWGKKDTVKK